MDYALLAREQNRVTSEILTSALEDPECVQALTRSYSVVTDLANCIEVVSERREAALFKHAAKEYQFALFATNQGFYRHGFAALRLSFELCLSAVEFSTNEISLRGWERDEHDINWRRLINPDDGVLSSKFVRIFFSDVEERAPHFRTLAEKVYRECSEYVHGNASTHDELPADFSFSRLAVLDWCEKASTIHMIILFVFFCRYLKEMSESRRKSIEDAFIEILGHIPAVRTTFGASA